MAGFLTRFWAKEASQLRNSFDLEQGSATDKVLETGGKVAIAGVVATMKNTTTETETEMEMEKEKEMEMEMEMERAERGTEEVRVSNELVGVPSSSTHSSKKVVGSTWSRGADAKAEAEDLGSPPCRSNDVDIGEEENLDVDDNYYYEDQDGGEKEEGNSINGDIVNAGICTRDRTLPPNERARRHTLCCEPNSDSDGDGRGGGCGSQSSAGSVSSVSSVSSPSSWDNLFAEEETGTTTASSSSLSSCRSHSHSRSRSRSQSGSFLVLRTQSWKLMAEQGHRAAQRAITHGTAMPQRLPDGTMVPARYWGISREQVEQLYRCAKADERWSDDDDVREFVQKFVQPSTVGTGHGVALHLNRRRPLQVNLMVSHAWSENCGDFFEDFLRHTSKNEIAFICFLSNYQGSPTEIDSQLGCDLSQSPFTQVLRGSSCERMLVIPNEALKASGEGLYSRLWCDWEIKVAADYAVPIHIPCRNSLEHLLGSSSRSSRDARCGDPSRPMNRDEALIRKAVESMPPETAWSHAVAVCSWTTCGVLVQCVALRVIEDTALVWFLSLHVGMVLGFLFSWCLSSRIRPWRENGYVVLDRIIQGAAAGFYRTRRLRKQDLLYAAIFVEICSQTGFMVHKYVLNETWDCAIHGHHETLGVAMTLWPLSNINKLGPWTGLYLGRWQQRLAANALSVACCASGAFVSVSINEIEWGRQWAASFAHGWFIGWMVSWSCLSIAARSWRHLIINLVSTAIVLAIRVRHTGMYQPACVVIMGSSAILVRPELRLIDRLSVALFQSCALVLMFLLVVQEDGKSVLDDGVESCA